MGECAEGVDVSIWLSVSLPVDILNVMDDFVSESAFLVICKELFMSVVLRKRFLFSSLLAGKSLKGFPWQRQCLLKYD